MVDKQSIEHFMLITALLGILLLLIIIPLKEQKHYGIIINETKKTNYHLLTFTDKETNTTSLLYCFECTQKQSLIGKNVIITLQENTTFIQKIEEDDH